MSTFKSVIKKMEKYLEKLRSSKEYSCEKRNELPEKGVYVFCEKGIPLYVGRTDNMKGRVYQHTSPTSEHNRASFAFMIAKRAAKKKGMRIDGKTRNEFINDGRFNTLFIRAKGRVSNMTIKAVAIATPIEQAIFEIYAHLELKTPYNNFNNH